MSTVMVEHMAVEVDGSGSDAVVLVHGLGGTSNVFTPQMDVLGACRAIRPDLPGSGRSPANSNLSIQTYVDAVLRATRALGVEHAHFVGHSMGTIVCCHLAVQHPGLVRSLALFGALLAPPDGARAGLRDRAATARRDGMAPVAEAIVRAATSAETRANQPATVALVREIVMRQDAEGYARSCEALAAAEPADVGRIACPVLLVTGSDDAIAPPQAMRALGDRMPQQTQQRIVLRGCGHWTTFERPREVNRELKEFYARRA